MAEWRQRCNIRQHINNEDLDDRGVIVRVIEEITKCSAFHCTLFADYLTEAFDLDDDDFEREVNGILDQIYDFADVNKIWMGS